MAGRMVIARRIAHGADTRVSVGDRWRDRRGGLPFARIRCLSRTSGERGGSAREGAGGSGSALADSDPWRTEPRHRAGGDRGYRQETGAYRSPEASYRRREDRSRRRGLEELFSGREGDLNADGEGVDESTDSSQGVERDDVADVGGGVQEEGASEQHDMPAEATEANPAKAGEAEETAGSGTVRSAREEAPVSGQQAHGGEQGGHASRAPDPRQQNDGERGSGRVRRIQGGITAGDGKTDRARQIRGRIAAGGREADRARRIRGGIAVGGGETSRARRIRVSSITERGEAGHARRIGASATKGGVGANRARQLRIATMTGSGEMGHARQICASTRRGSGKASQARQIGTKNGNVICSKDREGDGRRSGVTETNVMGGREGELPVPRHLRSACGTKGEGKSGRGQVTHQIGEGGRVRRKGDGKQGRVSTEAKV
ncbi:unnamed protein product [Closterium sp. NIES-64]|nr:unnamed protein product [Closterium sp. NIES-64]